MVKKMIFWLIAIVLLLLLTTYFFQEKVIFPSQKIDKNYAYNFKQSFEEINLKTTDNQIINGLYFTVDKPKGAVLFFHGNKGNLKRWGKIASYFCQFHYNVFVIDYRGYGKSTGSFNEAKMYEDAQLSYSFLKQKFPENKLVLYGRSLGTTFATKVASENNPKQLILESPFYNLSSAVKHQIKLGLKPILHYNFSTNNFIEKVNAPVLIFHGLEDRITASEDSEKLLKKTLHFNKKLVKIEEGTHHNLRDFDVYKSELEYVLLK